MPTAVFIALVLSGIAALFAGSGALALALLGAAVGWGFLCGLAALGVVVSLLANVPRVCGDEPATPSEADPPRLRDP